MIPKKFVFVILFVFTLNSFSQACGKYSVKLIGKLNSGEINVKKIKIPTIEFLHNFNTKNSQLLFTEIIPENNTIVKVLYSPLTSHLYDNSESLIKFYKNNVEKFPLTIYISEKGHEKEINIEIEWKNIIITKLIGDRQFINYFEINLNEISIKNYLH